MGYSAGFIWICIALPFTVYAFSDVIEEIPCTDTQLPCDTTGCIKKGQWCDTVIDCEDGSDEKYCARNKKQNIIRCQVHHFKCSDGSCIPLNGRCDGFPDCPDRSDESEKCSNTSKRPGKSNATRSPHSKPNSTESQLAIEKAKAWILDQRGENYGWDDTARAIVALYLIDPKQYIETSEGNLMEKQLNIEILAGIVKNSTKEMSLSKLAGNINSLLAMCHTPGAFQGLDLISMLRTSVDQRMRLNATIAPSVLLTLCVAGKSRPDDFHYIYRYIWSTTQHKLDLQAISVMVAACISGKSLNQRSEDGTVLTLAKQLVQRYEANEKHVYITALVIQALSSAGYDGWNKSSAIQKLIGFQKADGSFGDFLATYYALPALAGKSLIDIRNQDCNKVSSYVADLVVPLSPEEQKEIKYSLWIGKPVSGSHTMSLKIDSNWSFFDVMRYAASINDLFSFNYEDDPAGLSVYSISGVPNDIERDFHWNLYRKPGFGTSDQLPGPNMFPFVIRAKPNHLDHVIFWYKSTE